MINFAGLLRDLISRFDKDFLEGESCLFFNADKINENIGKHISNANKHAANAGKHYQYWQTHY